MIDVTDAATGMAIYLTVYSINDSKQFGVLTKFIEKK